MKDILKPILVLGCICLVVSGMLAFVNELTQPVIIKAEEEAAAAARNEVLKEAKTFEKAEIVELPQGILDIYIGDHHSGYAILTSAKGYGGDIRMICGISPDGTVEGVKILSHSETSGVGTKAADNNSPYPGQFVGKDKNNLEQVDTVTGATISSKAVKAGVALALQGYELAKEAQA